MSRRKRWSCGPPGRITAGDYGSARTKRRISVLRSDQILRELDAVAVRVIDVEQAYVAVQLEHRPDRDTRLAQTCRLGPDVLDVDVCDTAVLRLAFGQRDLHLASLKARPALLPVDEELLEPECVAVEGATCIEVAHAVPHRHSASAGLSTSAFSVRRKSAPTAPSI